VEAKGARNSREVWCAARILMVSSEAMHGGQNMCGGEILPCLAHSRIGTHGIKRSHREATEG
jgi:hypothetical protein